MSSSALHFLRCNNIVHGAINPKNILLKGTTPYLADFGIIVCASKNTTRQDVADISLDYLAPRLTPNSPNKRCGILDIDKFSFGCIMADIWAMANGRMVQQFRNSRQTYGDYSYTNNVRKVMELLSKFHDEERFTKSQYQRVHQIIERMFRASSTTSKTYGWSEKSTIGAAIDRKMARHRPML
ncbi:hypothetical protein EDC01DRAFT_469177 [Geopyxis carbonaria]|nr:hypothetical protein EDC01DRAFT_469177 [Geopyxis carbonaria]